MAEHRGAPAPTFNSFLPIAELQPSCSSTKAIKSVVALLWPYSASNKSITLLLVEPDFRLRRNKGQVRVEFHGSSAKEVARSGICSGDEVVLSLESGEWEKDDAGVRTPGHGVEWKLSFGEKVSMQIRRDSHEVANLNVDYPNLSPEPTATSITLSGSPKPRPAEASSAFKFTANSEFNVWRSPAFLKRTRTSSVSLLDSLYDAFAEESVDKPAKRSKVGRLSGQWRYGENIPSPQDGADTGLLVQLMIEAVEIEAELEAASEGETSDSPPDPIGDLNEAHADELANSAARAHPARSEETHYPATEEGPTSLEDEPFAMPWRDDMVEVTDSREGPIIDMTRDMSSAERSLSGSVPPMHGEKHSSIEIPDGSALHLIPTAMQTADTETASPPLNEDGWEAPVLPSSPHLRPTASPNLPLVSPIMGRLSMDSSIHEERQHQEQELELNPDTEEGEFESQSTPDPISELSDHDDNATRQSTEGVQDMDHSDSDHVSPSRSEKRQSLEGRRFNLDGSIFAHQTGRDPSDGSIMPNELVQETLNIPNIYARSSLQDIRSEPPSSVGSASDSDIGDDDESGTEDYEGLASYEESSEDSVDRTESMAEREPLRRARPEKEQSREDESYDEERGLLAQQQSYDWTAANNKNIEPLRAQGPDVIDLEDDSENDTLPDTTSPEVQTPEEASSSPVVVTSPLDDGSKPSEFDLSSSAADSINDDETSDYITYPTLPEEESEEPLLSYPPLPPEFHNTEAALGVGRGTQLFTPEATQLTHKERSVSIALRYDDYDLPTPQPTQTTSAGLLSLEGADTVEVKPPLRDESGSLTVPLAKGLGGRRSTVPDVISPWFALKRSSQVYEGSEEDDESDSESEQSLDSNPQDLSHPVVEPDSESKPHSQISELDTVTTIANGHTITQSTRPTPSMVGLRTPLSYFSPLAIIHDHFASTIDILAIVTSTTPMQRSKSGPKDYHLTLSITDPSSETFYTNVQIFRPFREALPVASSGAAILLRNFKVQSQKHKFVLVSTATSAWAVFQKGHNVQVNGPPVEIGAEERGFAKGLSQWWASLGQDVQGANGEKRGHDNETGELSITRGDYGNKRFS